MLEAMPYDVIFTLCQMASSDKVAREILVSAYHSNMLTLSDAQAITATLGLGIFQVTA